MLGKLKSKLLTYLFNDWLNQEMDVETLHLTKRLITKRESEIEGVHNPTGRTIVTGFKRYEN